LISLFLKCKNPGSGSGGAGEGVVKAGSGSNPATNHHHNQVNIKSILAELQERKEDCEKHKEKLERLEVCFVCLFWHPGANINFIFYSRIFKKNLKLYQLHLRGNDTEPSDWRNKSMT
jgi:hypothetical protein